MATPSQNPETTADGGRAPEQIIKRGEIVSSTWMHLADDQAPPDEEADVTVTLSRWQTEGDALRERRGQVGVRLSPDDEVEPILAELVTRPLIAIEFPRFTDGRGYSVARLLRDRHGYTGELRAMGNVLRDQLLYMQRCGFDAFALQPGKSIHEALEAFDELTVRYQADAEDPRPLFRRRASC